MTMHVADKLAFERATAVVPEWVDLKRASDAVALPRDVLLHAGPAFGSADAITAPILNSACVAAVVEGCCDNLDAARDAIRSGELQLAAAQDYNVVTPLAAVVSASMWLHEVVDHNSESNRAYTPINGGNGPAMRLGLCNDAVVQHIRWLNTDFADALRRAHQGPVDLLAIAAAALQEGDDCHGRTPVGTREVIAALQPAIAADQSALAFLQDGPSFFLNLWMAACKCALNAAVGTEGSGLVTAAGGNGAHTGIQVAGLPGQWFSCPADPPHGDLGDADSSRALGAIGDSAIVDVCGFGAMAMNFAPAQKQGLGAFMPADGLTRPEQLLFGIHHGMGELNFLFGLTVEAVDYTNKRPLISLGILDNQGELGRLGGGIFEVPATPFETAAANLNKG